MSLYFFTTGDPVASQNMKDPSNNVFKAILTHAPNGDDLISAKLDELVSITNKDVSEADSCLKIDVSSLFDYQA